MIPSVLTDEIKALDCSGNLSATLARMSERLITALKSAFDRRDYSGFVLLAVKLGGKNGELTTNLPNLKILTDKTVHLVMTEAMRREGLVKLTLPLTINDDTPFNIETTPLGKTRLKELEEEHRWR